MKMLELQQRFTNPEKELGPNYEAVFNFWTFIDTLSSEQKNLIIQRKEDFGRNIINVGYECRIVDYAYKVIENEGSIWQEVFAATGRTLDFSLREAITWATHELICMHELIAKGEQIVVIPLFDCATC
jgi:hypothetical protein